jgi:hypothetical protein
VRRRARCGKVRRTLTQPLAVRVRAKLGEVEPSADP